MNKIINGCNSGLNVILRTACVIICITVFGVSSVKAAAFEYSVDPTVYKIDFSSVAIVPVLQLADVNEDGYPDLLAQSYGSNLYLFVNNKSATGCNFETNASGADYIFTHAGYGCEIADWNHDGKLDVGNTADNSFYYQKSSGSLFTDTVDVTSSHQYVTGYGIVSANIGNASHSYGTVLQVSVKNGYEISYNFFWDPAIGGYNSNSVPYSLICGNVRAVDMDGDGLEDIIANKGAKPGDTSYNAPAIFYASTSSIRYSYSPSVKLSSSNSVWGIAAGDFNNDGKMDIVTAEDPTSYPDRKGTLNIYYQNSSGGFTADATPDNVITGLLYPAISPAAGGGISAALEVGDFNKDGLDDIIVGDGAYANSYVYIFLQDSTAGFNNFTNQLDASITIDQGGENLAAIKIADLNLDGADDLVFGYDGNKKEIRIMYGIPPARGTVIVVK